MKLPGLVPSNDDNFLSSYQFPSRALAEYLFLPPRRMFVPLVELIFKSRNEFAHCTQSNHQSVVQWLKQHTKIRILIDNLTCNLMKCLQRLLLSAKCSAIVSLHLLLPRAGSRAQLQIWNSNASWSSLTSTQLQHHSLLTLSGWTPEISQVCAARRWTFLAHAVIVPGACCSHCESRRCRATGTVGRGDGGSCATPSFTCFRSC